MKPTFKIVTLGIAPASVVNHIVSQYAEVEATRESFHRLNEDINFIVCDCQEAHGQVNQRNREASLWPRNGGNSWSITINW